MGLIKMNKRAAQKLIREGYVIGFIPCKIEPKSLWLHMPLYAPCVHQSFLNRFYDGSFKKFVKEYTQQQCKCDPDEYGHAPAYYLYMDFTNDNYDSSTLKYKQALKLYNELEQKYAVVQSKYGKALL